MATAQFCASMWTQEESAKIQATAKEVIPSIRTMALPQGLQVKNGPDAVVDYLVEKLPGLIKSDPERTVSNRSITSFRENMPDLDSPRFQTAKQQNPYEYFEAFEKTRHPPWLYNLTKTWEKLLEEPYKGVTTDGSLSHMLLFQSFTASL
jgi:hypothetical protein